MLIIFLEEYFADVILILLKIYQEYFLIIQGRGYTRASGVEYDHLDLHVRIVDDAALDDLFLHHLEEGNHHQPCHHHCSIVTISIFIVSSFSSHHFHFHHVIIIIALVLLGVVRTPRRIGDRPPDAVLPPQSSPGFAFLRLCRIALDCVMMF